MGLDSDKPSVVKRAKTSSTLISKVHTNYLVRASREMSLSTTAAAETVEYWPSFFGFLGVACALVFANAGAAYGTARSGVGLAGMGITNPNDVMKNIIAVVMAGVLGIYGLIVAVILLGNGECHLMRSAEGSSPAFARFNHHALSARRVRRPVPLAHF